MQHVIDISSDRLRLEEGRWQPLARRLQTAGLGAIVVALAIGAFGLESLLRAYVMNLCYYVSIALGALFFVLLQHLTRAGWSVVVRRLAELFTTAFPLLALLAAPAVLLILTGGLLGFPAAVHQVYPWTDAQYVAKEPLLQAKAPYLNAGFFAVRLAVYFAAWVGLSAWLLSRSLEQDRTGDPAITRGLGKWSAPAMYLFALTLTFFAFDVIMSLAPSWYSTIFGVYYFAGAMLSFCALLALTVHLLQRAGYMVRAVSVEHMHDVGKLVFAFVVFWSYIAFSQYMLIWYGNIPEETAWYAVRQTGGWIALSLLLLFGHFMLPFLMLISRAPKRRLQVLAGLACYVLVIHWLDIYYLVMPPYYFKLSDPGTAPFDLLGLLLAGLLAVGMGALLAGYVLRRMAMHPLIPERDPRLTESLAFTNI
ncbi:MAG: quinol:cytochrome C oxidoreductase [Phycisphaerae bacterium]|nr:quinol:cytochrome C oxidoreductase [Phycisphaerae bacterium]MCZ2400501.1 quinol:cytochrome C oxidoreductase [Phycisphaerae bacterium]NUQ48453.1 quinol:cytochrome C oxidoreductase [Phycisphaerae bacterium]